MEAILEQAKQFASATDNAGRKKLAVALRDLSYSLETGSETMARINSYPLRTAVVRSGVDLKLYDELAASEAPLEVDHLAEKTKADPALLGRLLRHLASFGFIKETGQDTFSSNAVTKVLADPAKQAEIIHFFDTVSPAYRSLPAYLRKSNFSAPTSANDCPFQIGHNTSKSAFEYFPELPRESQDAFNKYMGARTANLASWLSVYPLADQTADCSPEDVVFVDVGGGIGHQCQGVREKYPDLKGRVIVQDLEHAQRTRPDYPGVEGMVHDAFNEQPVKGARFYYLRAVLHDFPDDSSVRILSNLKQAMGPRSRILIDEMVLPNVGVDWTVTHTDLTMMASLAAKERTRAQWEALLDAAGLRIEALRHYEGGWGGYETVMEVVGK